MADAGSGQRLRSWWGTFDVPEGEVRYWRIGPLELWLARQSGEWRIRHGNVGGRDAVLDPHLEVDMPASRDDMETASANDVERVGLREGAGGLSIAPALADRFVITRPREPFTILPRGDVELYVTSPVWVQLSVGKPPALVRELPTHRPSDTWFGPTTRTGHLCYATRTHCRRSLAEVPLRAHRAITVVRIANPVDAPLLLERLAVPVPRLSLFAARDGSLFTERLTLTRGGADADLADLEIEDAPPRSVGATARIAAPREPGTGGRLIRAFDRLF